MSTGKCVSNVYRSRLTLRRIRYMSHIRLLTLPPTSGSCRETSVDRPASHPTDSKTLLSSTGAPSYSYWTPSECVFTPTPSRTPSTRPRLERPSMEIGPRLQTRFPFLSSCKPTGPKLHHCRSPSRPLTPREQGRYLHQYEPVTTPLSHAPWSLDTVLRFTMSLPTRRLPCSLGRVVTKVVPTTSDPSRGPKMFSSQRRRWSGAPEERTEPKTGFHRFGSWTGPGKIDEASVRSTSSEGSDAEEGRKVGVPLNRRDGGGRTSQ